MIRWAPVGTRASPGYALRGFSNHGALLLGFFGLRQERDVDSGVTRGVLNSPAHGFKITDTFTDNPALVQLDILGLAKQNI